jgi:OmpA-OmpF porin, OOP family
VAQSTTRCRWCNWPTVILLLVVLALIATIGGCSTVQHNVRQDSEAALTSAGLDDVVVDSINYRDVALIGPIDEEASALAAVEALPLSHEVSYEEAGTSTAPTTTVTLIEETTTTAATGTPTISLDGSVNSGKLVLAGTVPDEETRKLLLDQTTAAFGADNVIDQISVQRVAVTPELSAAAVDLAGLFPTFKENLSVGNFRLRDTALSITGRSASSDTLQALKDGLANLSGTTHVQASLDLTNNVTNLEDTIAQLLDTQQITFEPGSANLTSEGNAVLDEIASALQSALAGRPDLKVEIQGHTDSQGNNQLNQELSQERADAVLAHLIRKGLPADNFTAVGYGETRPIASNDTEEGRAANRRVEFKITEG